MHPFLVAPEVFCDLFQTRNRSPVRHHSKVAPRVESLLAARHMGYATRLLAEAGGSCYFMQVVVTPND